MDKPTRAGCCTDHDSESGCRNNYFDGKRLTTDAFRVEQRYFLERHRLLNRAVLGWGVVYGFAITSSGGKLTIGPGLALDKCGRELLQTGERRVGLDDLLEDDEKRRPYGEGTCWLLSAHYAEKLAGPVKVEDSCKCEHEEFERTCETVRYSLRRIPCEKCRCGCKCELDCECDDVGRASARPPEGRAEARPTCRCVCEHLKNWKPPDEDCSLCEVEDPCGRVRVDRGEGVPLACVTIEGDRDCPELRVKDDCGPRRLVMRNDVLFDLIRGCDLTRICEIGWKDWHRGEVSFEDFSAGLGAEDYKQDEYVTRDFWVRFSRPVQRKTLLPDCFAITVMTGEREGGWWQVLRVPILRVETDGGEWVEKATMVVDGAWVEDGVRGRRSIFIGSPTWVEIEVRGDFIVDCNGQTVDANAVGLSPGPTGNGTPGGTFVSTFRVVAARPYATEDRVKGASS